MWLTGFGPGLIESGTPLHVVEGCAKVSDPRGKMWLQGGLSSLLPHPGQLKGKPDMETVGWGRRWEEEGGHHGSK